MNILELIGDITSVIVLFVILSIAALKEQIKQYIVGEMLNSVENEKARLSKELAEHSDRIAREMEVYKITLIAETERIKARNDVKRSVALSLAQQKFDSITQLYNAHHGFGVFVAAHVGLTYRGTNAVAQLQHFQKTQQELLGRHSAYETAYYRSTRFLDNNTKALILTVLKNSMALLGRRPSPSDPVIISPEPTLDELKLSDAQLDTLINGLVESLHHLYLKAFRSLRMGECQQTDEIARIVSHEETDHLDQVRQLQRPSAGNDCAGYRGVSRGVMPGRTSRGRAGASVAVDAPAFGVGRSASYCGLPCDTCGSLNGL